MRSMRTNARGSFFRFPGRGSRTPDAKKEEAGPTPNPPPTRALPPEPPAWPPSMPEAFTAPHCMKCVMLEARKRTPKDGNGVPLADLVGGQS